MVVSLAIRNFRWQDLEQLTELTNEIGGITHTEKAFTPAYMREWLEQPGCRPEENCFIAEAGDRLAGYVMLTPELPIGRTVASGGVLEPFRGEGIGRRLLKVAIDHSRLLGAARLHIQAPTDGPAAQSLLGSEGFSLVRHFWQMRWEKEEVPPLDTPAGFAILSFRPGRDEEVLTRVQNAAFGENWGFCPNTVEQVAARARLSRCRPGGTIFVTQGGQVAGYNWTRIDANERAATGVVWMTGVHPDFRGKGLGRTVLLAGMHYLWKQGVQAIELEVDSANLAARELYLSVGFEKIGESVWYEKGLAP